MSSGSKKSLKTAQTRLGPPDLQNLEADELDSDDDDTASVASEQFYENIVSNHAFNTYFALTFPCHGWNFIQTKSLISISEMFKHRMFNINVLL